MTVQNIPTPVLSHAGSEQGGRRFDTVYAVRMCGGTLIPETQQKILKALSQRFTELDDWLRSLGLPRKQVIEIYVSVLKENGLMAKFVAHLTVSVLPSSAGVTVNPETIIEELRRAESGEFAAWLLLQPEPPADELNEFLKNMNSALANLRQHFLKAAKGGPRHKRGGRPRALDDPKARAEICAKIKARRGPGAKLQDIFKDIARECRSPHSAHNKPISSATIKRIWLECEDRDRVQKDSKRA